MNGLNVRAADDDSLTLGATDSLGRRKFSSDGTGLSAAMGKGTTEMAAPTGTGQGLREGAGLKSSGGMSKAGLGVIAGMLSQVADDQQALADESLKRVRPVQWQDPAVSSLDAGLMTSTKKAKVPARRGLGAVQRGRQGLDPIDANGVRMMDVQAKHRYAQELRSKLAKLKAKKGVK